MARLSDLPAETILHIASFLQPSEPPQSALRLFNFDAFSEYEDEEYLESEFELHYITVLPDPAKSIRSFAQVDRKHYEIVSAEARRSITISGSNVLWKVNSLLRLTSQSPLIRNAVRRLTLLLDPTAYGMPCVTYDDTHDVKCLTYDDVSLLRSMASEKQIPGVILDTTETPERGMIGGQRVCAVQDLERVRRPSCAVLEFAPEVLLLLNLPRLEDLTLCITAENLLDVLNIIRKGPLKLLALKSLTIKRLGCDYEMTPGDCSMGRGIIESLLEFAPQVTDLFIRDFELLWGLYPKSVRARGLCPESLTTLGLHNVDLGHDRQLKKMMARCKNLTKFAWRHRNPPMSPEDMIEALSVRADTLRTIWLDMQSPDHGSLEDPDMTGLVLTLRQFGKLENLWVDSGSFAPESRVNPEGGMEHLLRPHHRAEAAKIQEYEYPHLRHLWGNPLLRALPASLKRLHIWHSSRGHFNDDLKRLVKQRLSGAMPLLEEIGVDEIDAAKLKAMPNLAQSGVSICEAAPRFCPEGF